MHLWCGGNLKSKILNQKSKMFLIVGLGNPGNKYTKTRHNVGFLVVSALAEKYGLKFKNQPKFQSYIAEGGLQEEKVILAMPMTYMNNSGLAVSSLAQFYKIKIENIIVIHDEIDLPLGKMRVSFGASSGGHNGVASIIRDLGRKNFIRLRIGIGNELSMSRKVPSEKFVLQNFSRDEIKIISAEMEKYIEVVEMILKDGYEKAMEEFN